MRRTLAIAAMASLAGAAVVSGYSTPALSADHQDSPSVRGEPAADINDVFTWMDGNNVVLAMTVYPQAPNPSTFSNTVQYVFHTGNALTFGASLPSTSNLDVIATFDAATPQNIQLWVGNPNGTPKGEYVTGNAGAMGGIASADGKVKVFAGLVADPFFFNLDGFKSVVTDVEQAAATAGQDGGLQFDPFGCPLLSHSISDTLVGQLGTAPGGITAAQDHFATFDALAIVVSVDKTLLATNGNSQVTVWAATYNTSTAADAGAE
jgi:Domain of unknown function (DUF4331)